MLRTYGQPKGGGAVSFKEDGVLVVTGTILDLIEPDTTLVTNSPSGTARVVMSKYALLSGRSGGQTLYGGTAAGNNLTLKSSSDATLGEIIFESLGATGMNFSQNALGEGRLIIGGNVDPSSAFVPGGLFQFLIESEGNSTIFGSFNASSDAVSSPTFYGIKARGTMASPTKTFDGDTILIIGAFGYDSTNSLAASSVGAAGISILQDGNAGVGYVPGKLVISTTDTSGNLASRVEVRSDTYTYFNSQLQLGRSNPFGGGTVAGDTSGGGAQALMLAASTSDSISGGIRAILFDVGSSGVINIDSSTVLPHAQIGEYNMSSTFDKTFLFAVGALGTVHILDSTIQNTVGLFASAFTIDCTTNQTLLLYSSLAQTPEFKANSGATLNVSEVVAVFDNIAVNTDGSGGAAVNIPLVTSVHSKLSVNPGGTVTNRRGLWFENWDFASIGHPGVVTNSIAVDIEDQIAGTLTLSLRSKGAGVEMRHVGAGIFGANAAATNASTGLEVQSTTKSFLVSRMTTTQKNALTPVNGFVLYDATLNKFQGYENGAWVNLV